jgi:hypothetical protein
MKNTRESLMIVHPFDSSQFIRSLKNAGVKIRNEPEVIERLAEARDWRYALSTLVQHGNRIGIWFTASKKVRSGRLKTLLQRYRLSQSQEETFINFLQVT